MTPGLNSIVYSSKDKTFDMIRVLCKQRSGLNVCHINAQSLNNKIDEFRFIFENSGVDVVCVSETWFDPVVLGAIFDLDNYNLYRCDRKSHAGGVAIYVRKGIICKLCYNSEPMEQIEYLFVEITSLGNKMLVGCVYRPHRKIKTDDFLKILENLTLKYEDIVICGDFNSNALVESHLVNNMKTIGLYPTNSTVPTYYPATRNSLLDIIFVSNEEKILLYDQLTASCFSKHDLLFLSFDFKLQQLPNVVTYYDFKHVNHNILSLELQNIDWNSIYYMPSAETQLSFLEQKLEYVFNKSVPVKTVTNNYKKKPWFNADIKTAIADRDMIFIRWKRFKTDELHEGYCSARRVVNKMIKRAKSAYYSSIFTSAVGSKKTWKTIRDIGIGKTRIVESSEIDVEKLNETFTKIPSAPINQNFYVQNQITSTQTSLFSFNCVNQQDVLSSCLAVKSNAVGIDKIHPRFLKQIVPVMLPYITFIFNTIITKSTFPGNWKYAKIIPIPKANNEYRPIAILPYLSKVFEKLLHQQMHSYIQDNGLLTDRQSGFRSKHSCTTALIDVSEEIRASIDDGYITFLVLLDHSKAFDTVDHNILCMKLKTMFKFSDSSTRLICSYLGNRHQSVFANNKKSRSLPVLKGVPQGSILGPLLFTIYINDLTKQILYSNVHLYADDVQVYISAHKTNIDDCVHKLNEDLDRIHNWTTANGLCLNPSKSKCLVITPKSMKALLEPDIFLNNQRIELVKTTKNLGIIFNNTLTWYDHINAAAGKLYSMLRTLWKTQYFTPPKIRLLLAKTYLIPTLLYGCEIFGSCDSTSYNKLNVAYNAIIKYVFGLKKYDSISSVAKTLSGVTLSDLLKIRTLILLHKIVYTHEPRYLFDRISFTRSRRSNDLIQISHRTLTSEWQFYIQSIRLWNLLPSNIQFLSNAMYFKRALFKHFE